MVSFADRMAHLQRSFIREILKVAEDPSIISFAGGLPHPGFFPVEEIAAAAQAALREGGTKALQYATTEGYLPLREWIARRYAAQGLRVGPEQILVLNGSQQGLDLIAKVFIDPGDSLLVERPAYLAAIQAFGMFQPSFRSLLLEEDGVSLAELDRALRESHPKLLYAVPSFQNPSGISWSEAKRREAARLLRASGVVLVEDDPYGELRYVGEHIKPIKAFDDEGRVVYMGTFSKVLSPGLRVGWVVADPEILKKLIIAKQSTDVCTNVLGQAIAREYMARGLMDKQIVKIREIYGRKLKVMLDGMDEFMPEGVTWMKPEGGMFLWVTLPEGLESPSLLEKTLKEKVAFVSGRAFYPDPKDGFGTLRLNFSHPEDKLITEGLRRLGAVIEKEMASR